MITLENFRVSSDAKHRLTPAFLDLFPCDYHFELGTAENKVDEQERAHYREIMSVLDRPPFLYKIWDFFEFFHVDFGFYLKEAKRMDIVRCYDRINEILLRLNVVSPTRKVVAQTFYLRNREKVEYSSAAKIFSEVGDMAAFCLDSREYGNLSHSEMDLLELKSWLKMKGIFGRVAVSGGGLTGHLSTNSIGYTFGSNLTLDEFSKLTKELKELWSIKYSNSASDDTIVSILVEEPEKVIAVLKRGERARTKFIDGSTIEKLHGLEIQFYCNTKELIPILSYNAKNHLGVQRRLEIPKSYPFTELREFYMEFTHK